MAYQPPADHQALLEFTGAPYLAPADPAALLLEFVTGAEPQPPDRLPLPALRVGTRFASQAAGNQAAQARGHHHGTPEPIDPAAASQRTDQARPLTLAGWAQLFDRVPSLDRAPVGYHWDRPTTRDPRPAPEHWNQPERHDRAAGHPWDVQPAKDSLTRQDFNDPADHNVTESHQHTDAVLNWQPEPIEIDPVQDGTLNLERAPYTPPGAQLVDFELVPEALQVIPEPPTRSVDARHDRYGWSLKDALDGRTVHPWDRKPRLNTEINFPVPQEPNGPDIEPPPEPEIKGTYIVMNSSSLIALPSGTPLDFKDLNISLDADSFAWSMSVQILNRASMDLIRPTASGPTEVIATINGFQWRFVVERYSRDSRFGTEQYQVNGVSRSQLLAAPYAPRRTGRVDAPINMSQLMTQQLEYTGYTVTLQSGLPDFVIPADAWGYEEKTAIEVISELAAAVGAIVVPDRESDVLHIRHRYKQAGPWGYPALSIGDVDAIIADAMTKAYASQWEPQPAYNAVFVSGVTAGISVDVIRQGTAGDQPAPDLFDDLNLDASQCRLRGLSAIAASGDQEIVTIETVLPTSGAPGLIEPAMLIEYRDTREPTNTWRGNVLSNRIGVSKPGTGRVLQTVSIERHHYQE